MLLKFAITLLLTLVTAACGGKQPSTDAERRARGRELIERMSATLAGTQAFSVAVDEKRDVIRPSGEARQIHVARELVVRRPDRLYVRTTGDHENEAYYDGVGLTLVMHKEKVFGQARMPETLDRALDAISERYGIPIPLADFLYSSPANALLTDKTTGGWVNRENSGGQAQDHLAFGDTGVRWELWIPASGDPLPSRAVVALDGDKRVKKLDVTFRNWNLTPSIPGDRFNPKVPQDYEGIAVVQRAAVLQNVPDVPAPTGGRAPKREREP
jgi:hypothetical protein